MFFVVLLLVCVVVNGQSAKERIIEEMKQSVEGVGKLKEDLVKVYNKKKEVSPNHFATEESIEKEIQKEEEKKDGNVNKDRSCGSGKKIYNDIQLSVCAGGNHIKINEYFIDDLLFNASLIQTKNSTCRAKQCFIKEMFINENIYSIDQFGYKNCLVVNYPNSNEFMSDVDVTIVCDGTVMFNSNYYGFDCSTVNLVCDGKVISDHFYYTTNYTSFKQCKTVQKACNVKSECFKIDVNCPAEYQCTVSFGDSQPCSTNCTTYRPFASCSCPPDKTGKWCEVQTEVECEMIKVESNVKSFSQSKYLNREDPNEQYAIQIYPFDGLNDIEFDFLLSCTNEVTYDEEYDYWLNTSQLILSSNPERKLRVSVINFYHLAERSEYFEATINKDQYLSKEPIHINIDASFFNQTNSWNGDLLYAEVLIEPHFSSTSFAVYKFYVQRKHIEKKYNEFNWFKERWWVMVIVIGVISFCCFVGVWYYWHNREIFVRVKND